MDYFPPFFKNTVQIIFESVNDSLVRLSDSLSSAFVIVKYSYGAEIFFFKPENIRVVSDMTYLGVSTVFTFVTTISKL